jgi:hypothetical protein
MAMPGFTAQRSLGEATLDYRDRLRTKSPDGVLRPARLSILDIIRIDHVKFCVNPICYCAVWDPVYIDKCLLYNCYCP